VNTSPDTVELLGQVFEHAGFVVVSAFTFDIRSGKTDIQAFIRQHQPRVVVYDIAPPYERNFRLFQHVRSLVPEDGLRYVLTSTNAAHVQRLSDRDERIYEVVDKPVDLDRIVTAVKEAAKARNTR
jgi:DNA-binding NtrC family response regulator